MVSKFGVIESPEWLVLPDLLPAGPAPESLDMAKFRFLDAASGWWWNESAEQGNLRYGDTKYLVQFGLFEVVPMVYDDYQPPLGVGCTAQDALSRTMD